MASAELKVGDRVRVSFAENGTIVRLLTERGIPKAVVSTGGMYNRVIPVGNLTLISDDRS